MTALRTSVSTSRLNPRADRVCGNSRFACADMDVYIVIDPAVCCRCANRRNDHGPPLNPYWCLPESGYARHLLYTRNWFCHMPTLIMVLCKPDHAVLNHGRGYARIRTYYRFAALGVLVSFAFPIHPQSKRLVEWGFGSCRACLHVCVLICAPLLFALAAL